MANLNVAKQAAKQLGVNPPEGVVEGTPEYDQWAQAWFQAGVDSGDPRLVQMAGGKKLGEGGTEAGWEDEGGYVIDPTGKSAVSPSEWLGKRKPTPTELRRASFEGAYAGSEDGYNRFSDRQLADWINKNWDAQKGGFFTSTGQMVGKPPDRAADGSWASGYEGSGAGGKGGGAGGGAGGAGGPAQPPKPVTFGKQLSMTGDPMQDMLINQFNTGQNSTYGQGMNIFGLGEDRAVGGTGANADMKQPGAQENVAQSLRGGGLWYGQDKATFGGWDASKDQAIAGVKQTKEQKQDAKAYDKGKKNIAAPVWQQPEAPAAPAQQVNQEALTKSAPGSLQNKRGTFGKRPRSIGGMLGNRYSPSGGIF
jgi:hypothetical protein